MAIVMTTNPTPKVRTARRKTELHGRPHVVELREATVRVRERYARTATEIPFADLLDRAKRKAATPSGDYVFELTADGLEVRKVRTRNKVVLSYADLLTATQRQLLLL